MASQELPLQDYHDQYDHAEYSGDVELRKLNSQPSEQDGDQSDDDDDDASSVQSFELYTPDEESKLLRKLDARLVLFLALLYMLSFLDRSSQLIYPRSFIVCG